jgi:hypothetical protein
MLTWQLEIALVAKNLNLKYLRVQNLAAEKLGQHNLLQKGFRKCDKKFN